jgi:hypothetical protein
MTNGWPMSDWILFWISVSSCPFLEFWGWLDLQLGHWCRRQCQPSLPMRWYHPYENEPQKLENYLKMHIFLDNGTCQGQIPWIYYWFLLQNFMHSKNTCVRNRSCVEMFVLRQDKFCMEKPEIIQKIGLKTTKICVTQKFPTQARF